MIAGADAGPSARGRRGQLVLLAAATIAIALVPMAVAYLQLGYHADVAASADRGDPARNAERVLERAVHDAAGAVAGEYAWADRRRAVDDVDATLEPAVRELESARVEEGVGYAVERNATAAERWAAANCPSGEKRAFGPCEADDGIVLQERAGEATVLAVAFDLHVVEDRATTDATLVVRAVGDR